MTQNQFPDAGEASEQFFAAPSSLPDDSGDIAPSEPTWDSAYEPPSAPSYEPPSAPSYESPSAPSYAPPSVPPPAPVYHPPSAPPPPPYVQPSAPSAYQPSFPPPPPAYQQPFASSQPAPYQQPSVAPNDGGFEPYFPPATQSPTYDAPYGFPAPYANNTVSNGLGIAALVAGLLGATCLGLFAGIPAIIFGVLGRKAADEGRANNRGMSTAGIVLGAISIAWSVVGLIALVFAVATGN